jgi:hypothetical protein
VLPGFRKKFGPRGVIHAHSDGRIEDTGPLTKKVRAFSVWWSWWLMGCGGRWLASVFK